MVALFVILVCTTIGHSQIAVIPKSKFILDEIVRFAEDIDQDTRLLERRPVQTTEQIQKKLSRSRRNKYSLIN